MIFSPFSLSMPPFSPVLCDLRWNSPEPSIRNGATKGFSWSLRDCEDFLLMTGDTFSTHHKPVLQPSFETAASRPPQDEVLSVETQQPHAEERAPCARLEAWAASDSLFMSYAD